MSGAGALMSGFAGGFQSGRSVKDRRARMALDQEDLELRRSQPQQQPYASTESPQQPPRPEQQITARRPGSQPPASIGGWDGSSVDPRIASGTREAAEALGVDPIELATLISYETAGTFDPSKRGPTTQWGQHRGAIQFGEPQAKQYGVNWDDPIGSQFGSEGAIVKYMRDRGLKPGMGILDMYSTINAGAPGLYNRSDANNGGAPGTVRDKVEKQMAAHRAKAERLFAYHTQQPPTAAPAQPAAPTRPAAPPQGRSVKPERSIGEEIIARFY